MNILLVEDSKVLLGTLRDGLTKMGYAVDAVADGEQGLEYACYGNYDVIVLDLVLPKVDGLTVLRKLRAEGGNTHVLVLSARDQVEDRIRALQLGADDYMVKPFSFDELCARIATLIRRRYDKKSPEIEFGELSINTALREVRRKGAPIGLTPSEYAILEMLVLNRGRVISLEQLLDAVHTIDASPGTNVVQVMVCNLRRKIAGPGHASIIQTRRGAGYFIA